jgi:hypothetical protein
MHSGPTTKLNQAQDGEGSEIGRDVYHKIFPCSPHTTGGVVAIPARETVVATPTLFQHSAHRRQDERSRRYRRKDATVLDQGASGVPLHRRVLCRLRPTAADGTDP